jgi:hypothetical protein
MGNMIELRPSDVMFQAAESLGKISNLATNIHGYVAQAETVAQMAKGKTDIERFYQEYDEGLKKNQALGNVLESDLDEDYQSHATRVQEYIKENITNRRAAGELTRYHEMYSVQHAPQVRNIWEVAKGHQYQKDLLSSTETYKDMDIPAEEKKTKIKEILDLGVASGVIWSDDALKYQINYDKEIDYNHARAEAMKMVRTLGPDGKIPKDTLVQAENHIKAYEGLDSTAKEKILTDIRQEDGVFRNRVEREHQEQDAAKSIDMAQAYIDNELSVDMVDKQDFWNANTTMYWLNIMETGRKAGASRSGGGSVDYWEDTDGNLEKEFWVQIAEGKSNKNIWDWAYEYLGPQEYEDEEGEAQYKLGIGNQFLQTIVTKLQDRVADTEIPSMISQRVKNLHTAIVEGDETNLTMAELGSISADIIDFLAIDSDPDEALLKVDNRIAYYREERLTGAITKNVNRAILDDFYQDDLEEAMLTAQTGGYIGLEDQPDVIATLTSLAARIEEALEWQGVLTEADGRTGPFFEDGIPYYEDKDGNKYSTRVMSDELRNKLKAIGEDTKGLRNKQEVYFKWAKISKDSEGKPIYAPLLIRPMKEKDAKALADKKAADKADADAAATEKKRLADKKATREAEEAEAKAKLAAGEVTTTTGKKLTGKKKSDFMKLTAGGVTFYITKAPGVKDRISWDDYQDLQ